MALPFRLHGGAVPFVYADTSMAFVSSTPVFSFLHRNLPFPRFLCSLCSTPFEEGKHYSSRLATKAAFVSQTSRARFAKGWMEVQFVLFRTRAERRFLSDYEG